LKKPQFGGPIYSRKVRKIKNPKVTKPCDKMQMPTISTYIIASPKNELIAL
jgi:hypothetical protein